MAKLPIWAKLKKKTNRRPFLKLCPSYCKSPRVRKEILGCDYQKKNVIKIWFKVGLISYFYPLDKVLNDKTNEI